MQQTNLQARPFCWTGFSFSVLVDDAYSLRSADRDYDGIVDEDDQCPQISETFNKFEDEELNTLNESVRFIMETIDKALDVVLLTEKVRKTRGKKEYCVVSKKKKTKEGKLRTYGCYKSRKAANKRLGQVEGFKARAMAEGEEIEEYQIVEMSSMAGGNVQGYAGGNKNQFSLIREED